MRVSDTNKNRGTHGDSSFKLGGMPSSSENPPALAVGGVNECCNTCRHSYKLEKCDYSHGGCEHTNMEGYICMAFANERIACWMVGLDGENDMCECYEEINE